MKIKAVSGIVLTLLLIDMLTLAFKIQTVKASGFIYIRADGSVDPPTAPILSVDNVTYTFTGNINTSIVVERNNIVIDGADYILQGMPYYISEKGIDLTERSNVTIKNMEIKAFVVGIRLDHSSNINISGNNIIGHNYEGICFSYSLNNSIYRNNITANNRHGIRLYESSYNNIYENNITNNKYYGSFYGIVLEQSSNNSVSKNKISNYSNGVQLHSSSNNAIYRNNITANSLYGIELYNSPSNVLSDNVMAGNKYNFAIWGIELLHYMNDVDASNRVDGRTIFYVVNEQNLIIEPQTYPNIGYLAVINSTNITIRHQKMENNRHGILLAYTKNSIIQNVTAINNEYGIRIECSSNNAISRNEVSNNYNGISLDSSSNYNSIYENNITNNDLRGIWLSDSSNNGIYGNNITNNYYGIELSGSSNNSIYHNNFINNTQQVYDWAPDPSYILPSINIWDNGCPSGGNYWSDYTGEDQNGDGIGDTPYVIDENNQDNYPLRSPWSPKTPAEVPFWMQWWFWTIVTAGIVILAGTVYFLKKKKPPTTTTPPPPSEGTV